MVVSFIGEEKPEQLGNITDLSQDTDKLSQLHQVHLTQELEWRYALMYIKLQWNLCNPTLFSGPSVINYI